MNEKINKFLLAGDKFMSEVHLRQPGLTCSACRPLLTIKIECQKLKKQEIEDVFIKAS